MIAGSRSHMRRHPDASAIVGPAAWQDPQNDNHPMLVVEAEADAPVTDPQPPLNRIELPNVATAWRSDEPVESVKYPALNRPVESLQITPRRGREPKGPAWRQLRSSSDRRSSEDTPSPR